ncbi:MAG: PKD domain-containing protein [Methanoregula sp.]|nr:PKD domain-containing protein [Methanoregula sp.]
MKNKFIIRNFNCGARYQATGNQICTADSSTVQTMIIIAVKAIFFLVLVYPGTALDWTNETVDSPGNVGWYTSLALDNSGNPHISYLDWTNGHLKYASRAEGLWTSETVDTTNTTGQYSSLKLAASSYPLISYYDENQGNLSFAMKTGTSWSTVIADSGGVGRYTSLAVDGSGNPRICYQDLLNAKLKYTAKNGGIWNHETVDNAGNVGAYTSLALDSSGNPHISYYDAAKGDLKYAVMIGGNWTNQTIDSTGNTGYYTSIALDAAGNPCISYYDFTNWDLRYAKKTGSSWSKEVVDSVGRVGKFTSLALDSSGNPHISYFDETNGHLKYATKSGTVWTNETVDTAANVGEYSSLALSRLGIPRISYRDGGNGNLKYAIGIPPLLLNFTASPLNGSAPLTVRFSDTSKGGSPSHWNWSFGDGTWFNTSDSALRNPSHVYETPGTYSVNLMVQNISVTDNLGRSGYVSVIAPPATTMPTRSPTVTSSPTPVLTITPAPAITSSPTVTSPPTPVLTTTPTPAITSSPTPAITSSPTPVITTSFGQIPAISEDSGTNDDLIPVPSLAPVLVVPGSPGCQTVTVGGNSAISRVTVTGQDIADIIVTARQLHSLPRGVEPPDTPVYQYIDVVPARYTVISSALIEFEVPLFSITGPSASLNNVSLWILNNRTWISLPASWSGSKNGKALYYAESRNLSLFAITIRNETPVIPPGILPAATTEPEKSHGYKSRESDNPAIPDTPEKTEPGKMNTGFSFLPLIISTLGIVGIGMGIVLIRNRKER